MKPKLSIVIPTHNNIFLKDVLVAIIHCLGFSDDIQIVVVENPEITEKTVKDIEDACGGRTHNIVHIQSKLGANAARNAGCQRADADIIALIDDDCIVDCNWIHAVLSAHTIYPTAGIMGGPMRLIFKSDRPRWVESYFWSMLAGIDHGDGVVDFSHINDRYAGMIVSGNLTFKKRFFNQTDGFDETVGYIGKDSLMAHDEIRFIYECSQYGLPKKLYIGNIIVFHQIPKFRTEISYFLKRAYGDGYNFVKMIVNDKSNSHMTKEDIMVEYVLPRWGQGLNVGDITVVRQKIAHEESTRLYLTNIMQCKAEFVRGAFDYLNTTSVKSNMNRRTLLVIKQVNSI